MLFTWIKERLRLRGEDGWCKDMYDTYSDETGKETHCIVGWIRVAEQSAGCHLREVNPCVLMAEALHYVLTEDDVDVESVEDGCCESYNDLEFTEFSHIVKAVELLAANEKVASRQLAMSLGAGGTNPGDSPAPVDLVEVEAELVEV